MDTTLFIVENNILYVIILCSFPFKPLMYVHAILAFAEGLYGCGIIHVSFGRSNQWKFPLKYSFDNLSLFYRRFHVAVSSYLFWRYIVLQYFMCLSKSMFADVPSKLLHAHCMWRRDYCRLTFKSALFMTFLFLLILQISLRLCIPLCYHGWIINIFFFCMCVRMLQILYHFYL